MPNKTFTGQSQKRSRVLHRVSSSLTVLHRPLPSHFFLFPLQHRHSIPSFPPLLLRRHSTPSLTPYSDPEEACRFRCSSSAAAPARRTGRRILWLWNWKLPSWGLLPHLHRVRDNSRKFASMFAEQHGEDEAARLRGGWSGRRGEFCREYLGESGRNCSRGFVWSNRSCCRDCCRTYSRGCSRASTRDYR